MQSAVDLLIDTSRTPDYRFRIALAKQLEDYDFEPGEVDFATEILIAQFRYEFAGRSPPPLEGFAEARALAESDPRVRIALEGYVLADCSPEFIAARTGHSRKLITWFEAAFFAARERREFRDWVQHVLLAPRGAAGVTVDSVCRYLRGVAYWSGVERFEDSLSIVFRGTRFAEGAPWASRADGIGELGRRGFVRILLAELLIAPVDCFEIEQRMTRRLARVAKREKRVVEEAEERGMRTAEVDRVLLKRYGIDPGTYEFFAEVSPSPLGKSDAPDAPPVAVPEPAAAPTERASVAVGAAA